MERYKWRRRGSAIASPASPPVEAGPGLPRPQVREENELELPVGLSAFAGLPGPRAPRPYPDPAASFLCRGPCAPGSCSSRTAGVFALPGRVFLPFPGPVAPCRSPGEAGAPEPAATGPQDCAGRSRTRSSLLQVPETLGPSSSAVRANTGLWSVPAEAWLAAPWPPRPGPLPSCSPPWRRRRLRCAASSC